ncbi:MAG: hypothetical protein JWO38_3924 [Gemmataceae bacterium]|nr:hypothetical protein [Gemmataceae bacterium]
MNATISRSLLFACLFLMTAIGSGQTPHVAPPPRRAILFDRFWGKVTDVGKDFIEIQGLYIEIKGEKRCKTERKLEGRKDVSRDIYTGDAVTVRGPGRLLTATRVEVSGDLNTVTVTAADGAVSVLRRSEEIPRRFEVSDWLRTGGFMPGATDSDSYRLADVRVGDEVMLEFQLYHQEAILPMYNICSAISIKRRPGGRVPPSPTSDPTSKYQYHEVMNAYQDWEEFGTPIPDKYHPRGPQAGIAPPPKPVTPRIPDAAP